MHIESAARRLHPRITDCDWLVLRGMRAAIDRIAAQAGHAGATAVDLGCGSQPYRPLFDARGYLEELLTPEWVRRDNGCVYVTLSRARKGGAPA